MSHILALLVGIFTSAFVMGAAPRDANVSLSDVPAAAVNAVKNKFPGADIQNRVERDNEATGVFYEFDLWRDGCEIDIEVSAEGLIREYDAEMDPADLPRAVASAIAKKFPGGKVTKAKEEFKRWSERERTVYEADVLVNGRKVEVEIDPDGKILDFDD